MVTREKMFTIFSTFGFENAHYGSPYLLKTGLNDLKKTLNYCKIIRENKNPQSSQDLSVSFKFTVRILLSGFVTFPCSWI